MAISNLEYNAPREFGKEMNRMNEKLLPHIHVFDIQKHNGFYFGYFTVAGEKFPFPIYIDNINNPENSIARINSTFGKMLGIVDSTYTATISDTSIVGHIGRLKNNVLGPFTSDSKGMDSLTYVSDGTGNELFAGTDTLNLVSGGIKNIEEIVRGLVGKEVTAINFASPPRLSDGVAKFMNTLYQKKNAK